MPAAKARQVKDMFLSLKPVWVKTIREESSTSPTVYGLQAMSLLP